MKKQWILLICLIAVIIGVVMLSFVRVNWKGTPLIDFANIHLPNKENYCLLYQKQLPPRLLRSPVFNVDALKLEAIWFDMIKQWPRTTLLKRSGHHFQYVVRSKIFRFPDLVDVQIVRHNDHSSQIFIYSRSVYGYSDLGVNPKRVRAWLHRLKVLSRESFSFMA